MNLQGLKKFAPFFAPKYKLPVHIVQLILAVVVVALSAARMTMKNRPRGRSTTMGLGMGAKSIVIILYQLLTEHVPALHKWASLKAFAILNCLEIVFWGAVCFMVFRANLNQCDGMVCTLGWVVVGVAVALNVLAQYTAISSVLDYLHFRKTKAQRGDKSESPVDQESLESMPSGARY